MPARGAMNARRFFRCLHFRDQRVQIADRLLGNRMLWAQDPSNSIYTVVQQPACPLLMTKVSQGVRQVGDRPQGIGMVVSQDFLPPAQVVFVPSASSLGEAERLEIGAEAVCGDEGVRMVVAETASPSG